jgi:ferrochelatase
LGFVFDHVEVLYDLGVEARAVAERRGLAFSRVLAPGAHPALVDDLASRIVAAAEQ